MRLSPFRRILMLVALSVVAGVASASEPAMPFLLGADVSALATLEKHGAIYRSDGREGDALAILRKEGMNVFRLRLFVNPNREGVVTNDLQYTLALARRVKDTGAALLLDFHYSDTWADPEKQYKPAAWKDLPFEKLVEQLRSYTRDVLKEFAANGVTPEYVHLGNEITNGMLWPEGRVEYSRREESDSWKRLGELLRAAHAGLADAFPKGKRPISILHIESPHQRERAVWYCREAIAAGVPFDVIGMSYYPEWHRTPAELKATLTQLATEFRKPIVVAETAYPWTDDEHWKDRPHMNWPLTPEGQQAFLKEVLAVVRGLPDELGRGVIYWHPESVRVRSMPVWLGGSCALFDREGDVLPGAAIGR